MSDMSFVLKLRPRGPWHFASLADPAAVLTFTDIAKAEAWTDAQDGPTQFLPFGPRRDGNALVDQRHRASAAKHGRWSGRAADAHRAGHDALLANFAALNGFKRSPEFTLDALSRGMCHGGSWGAQYQWPGSDHVTYFRRGRRTAAVLAEPYRAHEFEALQDYAAARDLIVYSPPNLRASYWFPGHTFFALIMRRTERPRFLRDQLQFETSQNDLLNVAGR